MILVSELLYRSSVVGILYWYIFMQIRNSDILHKCIMTHPLTGARGHGGRVVTLSPPTSAAGVRSPSWP